MNRIDVRFPTMGTEAHLRLESATRTTGELEPFADAIRSGFGDVEAALSRFRDDSELNRVNRDPRAIVPASPLMCDLAAAARWAATRSGGLVDATLVGALEDQGYVRSRVGVEPASIDDALAAAPPRAPARAHPDRAHASITVGASGGTISRPAGLRLDSGGLAKGIAADQAAATLPPDVRYALSCGGDLAVGGPPGQPWDVAVTHARTGEEAHRIRIRAGGVATSGIHARLWRRSDGSYAHHVLDPSTGEPAWTGLVAVTAVAPTALEAEVLAKTALLSGPDAARELIRTRGGVLQHDDGRVEIVEGLPVVRLARPRIAV